jgi:hypothetical protein
MNLADIREKVTAYVNRNDPDFVDNLDHFIQAGHRWLERKFHGREALFARWEDVEQLPPRVGVVPLPACYRASAELRVRRLPDRIGVQRVPLMALRMPYTLADGTELRLQDTTLAGDALYFAVNGRALELRPLSDRTTEIEIEGTGWAEPMRQPEDETVLTQEAPDAVIYAACREVWLFMGDDPQKTYWEAQAGAAIDEWVRDQVHQETPPPLVSEIPG